MKARILLFLILTGSLFYQQSFAQMSNSNEPASVSSDSSSGVQTTYNILNLPSQQTASGQTISHSYLADGSRWKSVNASGSGFTYRGSFEYDGAGTTLRSVGFSEGRIHASTSGALTDVAYHIKDHLGSVRAIVNASGAVTERNDYHPYGARHSNSSLTKTDGNRWRFSGKEEFDDAFGLPQSDFGARFYDRAAWSSLDPLAEKYYSLSPYAFCAGNPIIFVDRDGRDIWTINKDGYIEWKEASEYHYLYSLDNDGNRTKNYIQIYDRSILDQLSDKQQIVAAHSSTSINDMFNVFLFAANNTNVEWAIHRGTENKYTIGTSHKTDAVAAYQTLSGDDQLPIASLHSHPNTSTEMGIEISTMGYHVSEGYMGDALKYILGGAPRYNYVYFPKSKRLYNVRTLPAYIKHIHSYNDLYFGTLNYY